MRFTLQMGGRQVVVLSRDRFIEFDSLSKAAEWVADYIISPESLFTLRASLAADPAFQDLLRLDLADLVMDLARMMVSGRLYWLLDPGRQLPWRWRLPATPSFPEEDAAGAAEPTSLTGEADKAEEEEDEYEEIKPEPVIPPEFPRLAKREADAVDYSAKKMGNKLDLMRFVGEKPVPESMVAKTYPELANQQAGALDEAVADAAGTLASLAGAGGRSPKSSVAQAMPQMAAAAAKSVTASAETLDKHAGSLLAGAPFFPKGTEVGPAIGALAERQGHQVKEQAAQTGQALDALDGPAADKPGPGTIGPAFTGEADRQGKAIGNTAGKVGEDLAKLNVGAVDPPPASETKTVFQQTADSQIHALGEATEGSKKVLDALASTLDQRAPDPGRSNTAGIFQKDSAAAGEAVGEAAGRTRATLDTLRPDDPKKAAAAGGPKPGTVRIKLEGPPGVGLEGLLFTVRFGGEEKIFQSDASGVVELTGVPEAGYDIVGIKDGSGLEIVDVSSSPLPPPAPDGDPA